MSVQVSKIFLISQALASERLIPLNSGSQNNVRGTKKLIKRTEVSSKRRSITRVVPATGRAVPTSLSRERTAFSYLNSRVA